MRYIKNSHFVVIRVSVAIFSLTFSLALWADNKYCEGALFGHCISNFIYYNSTSEDVSIYTTEAADSNGLSICSDYIVKDSSTTYANSSVYGVDDSKISYNNSTSGSKIHKNKDWSQFKNCDAGGTCELTGNWSCMAIVINGNIAALAMPYNVDDSKMSHFTQDDGFNGSLCSVYPGTMGTADYQAEINVGCFNRCASSLIADSDGKAVNNVCNAIPKDMGSNYYGCITDNTSGEDCDFLPCGNSFDNTYGPSSTCTMTMNIYQNP